MNNSSLLGSLCKLVIIADLLGRLCELLMASGVPADVLTETINAVSEAIRGSQSNQDYFATVMAPTNPPRCVIIYFLTCIMHFFKLSLASYCESNS